MKPKKMVLRGSQYVAVGRSAKDDPFNYPVGTQDPKLLWDDIPLENRVSEERIRKANGATVYEGHYREQFLRKHLETYGCPVARPFTFEGGKQLYSRCPWKPQENGYCKYHKRRAL